MENTGGCLVVVDAVAPYHAAFTEAMRRTHGKVLAEGLPRITRYRPGASRFTVMDPSGNSIILIQRDEPMENDDRAAFRALNSGLRRHGDKAPAGEQAVALAVLIELSVVLDESERVPGWGARLRQLVLTVEERRQAESAVADPTVLEPWMPDAI